jgi:ribosomal protein S18
MIREIMIKPGEEFTPEKIVNLALRQDIGIDNASSINPKYIRDKKNLSYERKFRLDSDHPTREDYLRPQDYFSQEKGLNPMDFRKTRGLIEIGKPLRRGIIRKKSRRAINSLDIHWRNTALLSKFLTASSTIKTRIATCLPKFQQKRIARTIKHARNMNLLPFTGFLKSYHKKSLKTIHDDLQHTHQQLIDIETGAIKLTQPTTKWNHSKMISATEMGRFLRYNEKYPDH